MNRVSYTDKESHRKKNAQKTFARPKESQSRRQKSLRRLLDSEHKLEIREGQ